MATILKVVHLSSHRTKYFSSFESICSNFFSVFPPQAYGWKDQTLNFKLDLNGNSISFTIENDNFILSIETVI